jgi:hypothetical protein
MQYKGYRGGVKGKTALLITLLLVSLGSAYLSVPPAEAATTIIVNKTITLTSSFNGNGNTYKHGPSLGDYPVFWLTGTGVTLSNAIIDDSNYRGTNAAVMISGTSNSIKYCTLNNCVRYGFTASDAAKFYIGYNTVNKAQYGISGASGRYTPAWSTDGVIEYNNIMGAYLCGIKVKAFNRVTIQNNYIDVTPTTSYSTQGVHFSNDAPNLYVIVKNNNIVKKAVGTGVNTFGVWADPTPNIADPTKVWTGNQIIGNKITSCRFGIYLRNNNFRGSGNVFTSVDYALTNYGTNNVITL